MKNKMSDFLKVYAFMGFLRRFNLDVRLSKWFAFMQVSWENLASEEAKVYFDAAIHRVRYNLPEKIKPWDDFRAP